LRLLLLLVWFDDCLLPLLLWLGLLLVGLIARWRWLESCGVARSCIGSVHTITLVEMGALYVGAMEFAAAEREGQQERE